MAGNEMSKRIIIFTLIVLSVSAAFGIDLEKMNAVLKLQQEIIDNIIDSDSVFKVDLATDGLYIKGLGVVFNLTISENQIAQLFGENWEYTSSQIDVSMEEVKNALTRAEKALERKKLIKLTQEITWQRDDIARRRMEIEQERYNIDLKSSDFESQRRNIELERQDIELANLDEKLKQKLESLSKELNRIEDAPEVIEEAIRVSKQAIEAMEPKKPFAFTIGKKELAERKETYMKNRNVNVSRMLNSLKDYLASYGPVLNVPTEETVSLRIAFTSYGPIEERLPEMQLTALGTNLTGMKSGNLKRDVFLDNLVVIEISGENSVPTDIAVMKNILKTAFDKEGGGTTLRFINREDSWESYIPGFGAVFYHQYHPNPGESFLGGLRNFDSGLAAGKSKNIEMQIEESVLKLQNEISKLMVTYSPTLSSLQTGEHFVVAVKIKTFFLSDTDGLLVLRLKKENIDNCKNDQELMAKIQVVNL